MSDVTIDSRAAAQMLGISMAQVRQLADKGQLQVSNQPEGDGKFFRRYTLEAVNAARPHAEALKHRSGEPAMEFEERVLLRLDRIIQILEQRG